jgi:hypothetical protein
MHITLRGSVRGLLALIRWSAGGYALYLLYKLVYFAGAAVLIMDAYLREVVRLLEGKAI